MQAVPKSFPKPLLDGRFRLSTFWTNKTTVNRVSPDRNDDGHTLLQMAGFLAPVASGFFHLLPLGLRVKDRLERLIDGHMMKIGRLDLSTVCDHRLWQQSGRLTGSLEDGGHELMRISDRKDSGFILSPTHEEVITTLVKPYIQSYRELPLRLYQTTRKYRDELRPRQGLLRTKEFYMKDLYTFDATADEAMHSYALVRGAYDSIFQAIGVPFLTAEADSGNIGGKLNHEYHYASPIGEDTVWSCNACSYVANDEVVDVPAKPSSISQESTTSLESSNSNNKASYKCPRCTTGTLTSQRTIEVGHTFFLGTRYSSPLQLLYNSSATTTDASSSLLPVQMGCHGLGVSRLIGALASLLTRPTGHPTPAVGLRWPRLLAPFDVAIVHKEDSSADAAAVYDRLTHSGNVEVVLDDRLEKVAWKIQRADLTGYPVVVVLGSAWDRERLVEVQCRETRERVCVGLEEVVGVVGRMLRDSEHVTTGVV